MTALGGKCDKNPAKSEKPKNGDAQGGSGSLSIAKRYFGLTVHF